jgi:RimJ/RimL family protein N-acetyltransferase
VWLCELHNDPEVLKNLTNPNEITIDDHLSWWSKIKDSLTEKRFIFTIDDVPAGFTKFYSIDTNNHSCVLGADLHKNFRGQGHAKHMWKLMLQYCFCTLKLHRVSLTTASYNHIAQRVYKGIGFKNEGFLIESLYRDGQYYDQILMYMLRRDWDLLNKESNIDPLTEMSNSENDYHNRLNNAHLRDDSEWVYGLEE